MLKAQPSVCPVDRQQVTLFNDVNRWQKIPQLISRGSEWSRASRLGHQRKKEIGIIRSFVKRRVVAFHVSNATPDQISGAGIKLDEKMSLVEIRSRTIVSRNVNLPLGTGFGEHYLRALPTFSLITEPQSIFLMILPIRFKGSFVLFR